MKKATFVCVGKSIFGFGIAFVIQVHIYPTFKIREVSYIY